MKCIEWQVNGGGANGLDCISNVLFYIVAAVVAFCIGQAAWYYFSTRLGLLSRDSLFQAMSLFINRLIFMVLIIMTLIVWWVFMIVRWEEAGWRKVILFCSARLGLAR
jgi:ABC-type dipeptide/oligopeptide/nickel transport system permease component